MKILQIHRKHHFVVTICAVFILLIASKALSPLLKLNRTILKEVSLSDTETDSEKPEKKSGKNEQDQKEYIFYNADAHNGIADDEKLLHRYPHTLHYISNHFYQITSPPPDSSFTS